MPAFFSYLQNITYYLMFATVAGMIAPAGKYRKFVSLVMGFILLAVMLAPLARWSGEIPVTEWFHGIMSQTNDARLDTSYTNWRDEYLQGAFEEQLRAQLKEMLANNGFTVYSAEFTYTDDFSRITGVTVTVSRQEDARRVPFIRIEPVQIGSQDKAQDCPATTEAKSLISQFYNLPREHIYVYVTRRY